MFKIFKDGQLPTRGTKHSACVDLYSRKDVVIKAGETVLIPLGVCIGGEMFDDLTEKFKKMNYLQLMLRSSLSKYLIIANGVGVIDLDYEDEIMVRVHNPLGSLEFYQDYTDQSKKPVSIKKGDRVAQISLLEHKSYLFGIDTDEKRTGGFGSTNS